MTTVFDALLKEMQNARESATLERFSAGFSHERVKITAVHFPEKGFDVGAEMHPDDYIRAKVKLHHSTWIVGPLDRAIALLETHHELLRRVDDLRKAMGKADMDRIAELQAAGRKQVEGY